ncbi:MAG: hypothetical protein WCD62_16130, partial [Pseudolabrys sp.]
ANVCNDLSRKQSMQPRMGVEQNWRSKAGAVLQPFFKRHGEIGWLKKQSDDAQSEWLGRERI